MAEGIFRKLASQRLRCEEDELRSKGIDALSAGIAAGDSFPASPEAISLLRQSAIDISGHLSQQVTGEMVSESDLIYVMTRSHLEALSHARPDIAGRMKLIKADGGDVSDPIGGGIESYRQCADELTTAVEVIVDEVIQKDSE